MSKRIVSLFIAIFMLLSIMRSVDAQDSNPSFPVTIEHKFGTTTITEPPQRIISLGYTEQDPLFALGAKPIAVRYWYGDAPNAIFPWATDAAGDAQPEVLNMPYGNLNYEAILALQPDLISAIDAGITQEEYDILSEIAPTIAQYDDYVDFGMPWQETTRLIGMVLGKSVEAETLVTDVEARLAEVREENPQFTGKTVVVAYHNGATYGYYTNQDSRGRFFTDLGFIIPDELNEIAGDSFYADISQERLDLLDQDLIVFLALQFYEDGSDAARDAIEADPLLGGLRAMRENRVLFVSDAFDDALQFSTVLSLDYLLDGLVPELSAIISSEDTVIADDACEDGLHGVEDAVGAVICVPENPQRVVALAEGDIDGLLALGVDPVGVTNGRGQSSPPRYLNEFLPEDAISVGGFYQPNLEVILGLDPDLILFAGFSDPDVLEQLNAIAPVYNTATAAEDWRTQFGRVGLVMNMEDVAAAFLQTYDERVATLGEAFGDNADTQFIVARWDPAGPQIMAHTTFSSRILLDLGFAAPAEIPELQEGHPHSAPLSLEAVDILDVDWAFVGTLQGEGDAVDALEDVLENPLFQQLQVVQNEHLILVDGSLWTSVGGPLGAMTVLDDIENAVLVDSE
jgi:iron complex transport system substrate-binding protein